MIVNNSLETKKKYKRACIEPGTFGSESKGFYPQSTGPQVLSYFLKNI